MQQCTLSSGRCQTFRIITLTIINSSHPFFPPSGSEDPSPVLFQKSSLDDDDDDDECDDEPDEEEDADPFLLTFLGGGGGGGGGAGATDFFFFAAAAAGWFILTLRAFLGSASRLVYMFLSWSRIRQNSFVTSIVHIKL
jgi:hypothetical protein